MLRTIGTTELLNDLHKQIQEPQISQEIEETLKNLVNEEGGNTSFVAEPRQQLSASQIFSQIPERDEEPSFAHNEFQAAPRQQTTMNPFQTTFNVKQFNITTQAPPAQLQSVQVKAEHNYLETMHKGSQLKEVCELPFVMLCDEDEKALFDLGV